MKVCKANSIKFFSSGFDLESIDLLLSLGLTCIKIPSGEVTNLPYLKHVSKKAESVIVSTGMCDLDDIGVALEVLQTGRIKIEDITVLHCNTEYPTPMKDVNLRARYAIKDRDKVRVGYSDDRLDLAVQLSLIHI